MRRLVGLVLLVHATAFTISIYLIPGMQPLQGLIGGAVIGLGAWLVGGEPPRSCRCADAVCVDRTPPPAVQLNGATLARSLREHDRRMGRVSR